MRRKFRAAYYRENECVGIGLEEIRGVNEEAKPVYIASIYSEAFQNRQQITEYAINYVKELVGSDDAVLRVSGPFRKKSLYPPNIRVRSGEKTVMFAECYQLASDALNRKSTITEVFE